jgi:hypothetical protein
MAALLSDSEAARVLLDFTQLPKRWKRGKRRQQEEQHRAALIRFFAQREKEGAQLESAIRAELGNTPSVSKALRSAVREGLLLRSGGGGRPSPYSYRWRKQIISMQ